MGGGPVGRILPAIAVLLLANGCCSLAARRASNPVDRINRAVFVRVGPPQKCPVVLPPWNTFATLCPGRTYDVTLYAGSINAPLEPQAGVEMALDLIESQGAQSTAGALSAASVTTDARGRAQVTVTFPAGITGIYRVRATYADGATRSVTYSRQVHVTNDCLRPASSSAAGPKSPVRPNSP